MTDEEIIKSLTKKQKENLLDAYKYYLKTGIKHEDNKNQIGTNLRTGTALCKKGLVDWSVTQVRYWTRWEITKKGIYISEIINKLQ